MYLHLKELVLAAVTARYQFMEFYAMAHYISLPLVFPSMPICIGGLLIVCIEEGVL